MINLIKPIRDPDAYMLAMVALQELVELDPALGTPEGDQLELLALVIEDYEKRLYGPIPNLWRDDIEARCAGLGLPFDPLDPELTIATLLAHQRADLEEQLRLARAEIAELWRHPPSPA